VLAAGVHIGVRAAFDHGHRLHSGRIHVVQGEAEPFGDEQRLGRGPASAHHHGAGQRSGGLRHLVRAEHQSPRRQGDGRDGGRAVLDQRDMHCPVRAPPPELAGPVQRVHAPPPSGFPASGVIPRLFGEDRVQRTTDVEHPRDELLREQIARVAQVMAVDQTRALDVEENPACVMRELRRQLRIACHSVVLVVSARAISLVALFRHTSAIATRPVEKLLIWDGVEHPSLSARSGHAIATYPPPSGQADVCPGKW
jgi:hypothetical protein